MGVRKKSHKSYRIGKELKIIDVETMKLDQLCGVWVTYMCTSKHEIYTAFLSMNLTASGTAMECQIKTH